MNVKHVVLSKAKDARRRAHMGASIEYCVRCAKLIPPALALIDAVNPPAAQMYATNITLAPGTRYVFRLEYLTRNGGSANRACRCEGSYVRRIVLAAAR